MSALPMPTLDHVVINVRDRIDEGAETFRRLGFTLTPRGYHTLGSMNHLAVFGTDYLELIAAPAGSIKRADILSAPDGLNGLVFGTYDANSTYAALHAAGVPVQPPNDFSRPVAVPGGPQDAKFRTIRLVEGTVTSGRVYFCQHFTPELVWRDEWRHHANGVIGVTRALIAAHDPSGLSSLFRRMFGIESVRETSDGCSLAVGLSRFDLVPPEVLIRKYGDALPDGCGRTEYMAGLSFRTRSLDTAAVALTSGQVPGVCRMGNRIVVPPSAAFGVMIEFVES